MPNPLSDAQQQQVDAEIFAGRLIQAVKLHREFAGTDLKTAKEAVDARAAELRQQFPDRFPARKGCLGGIVVLTAIAAPAAWLLRHVTC